MKKGKIVLLGDPVLREKAKPVTVFHKKLHAVIDMMKQTLIDRGDGAAVAANQVEIAKRIVVINYLGEYIEMLNPEILRAEGSQTDYEGCLSLPGLSGTVTRAETVEVRFVNRNGAERTITRTGRMARCIQHEIDHLDGVLYIDRLDDTFVVDNESGEKIEVKDILDGKYTFVS